MPAQRDVSAQLARALANPLRIGILTSLRDGPMAAAALARRLGTDERTVMRHARELSALGFIQRWPSSHVYELIVAADFPDEIWAQLPTPVKQAAVAATLAQIQATTATAVTAGGFDRREMHLTRTSLVLDDEGWSAVSRDMLEFRLRLQRAHEEAATRLRGGAGSLAQAVLMLFTSPEPGEEGGELPVHTDAPESAGPDTLDVEEGRARAYELHEALGELLTSGTADWQAILARVDELRLVVRATARAADGAARGADVSPGA